MKRLLIVSMATLTVACQEPKEASFCFNEMSYSPTETVFRLFAPSQAQVSVVLGQDTIAMDLEESVPSGSNGLEGAVWTATVKGDHKGKEYVFLVDGQASPGVFAKAVTVNGAKGVVVDLRDTDPEGWQQDSAGSRRADYADWVVYELHHRDFSIARADAVYPGKFLALTEPWAIEHLTQLGVNAIHILPSYDYGSVDETRLDEPQYNWGYDPVNYNVPEGSYSTDPTDPLCRIREFKQMVQALHQAGINVVLDVVYNHTYDIDHSNFQRTFPDYYYRKTADSTFSNGSGCGNETASEQPMMRRFIIESVKYWAKEYHIDGFRFDLMGCHDIETMNQIRAAIDEIDPHIFIYGEGWSAGQCALPSEQLALKANMQQLPRIAAFCDDMRDALRGPFSDDTQPGWLGWRAAPADKSVGSDTLLVALEESLKFGIVGAISHPQIDMTQVNYSTQPFALEPTQTINYVSCHDDMCLTDRLRASIPGITTDELIRLDLLAQTAVFTSQGVPFMLAGEELLRTKQGVHNSFESPDTINQIDWTNKTKYPQVFQYYRDLIALRAHHPAFRLGSAELVRRHLEFLPTDDSHVVAFHLKDNAGGDDWKDIIVVLNASREARTVSIPDGQYIVMCANGRINELEEQQQVQGTTITVASQSAMILHDYEATSLPSR